MEFKNEWVETKEKLPEEGDTVLAVVRGYEQPIVLTLLREYPHHEETYDSFLYWEEPVADMVEIELYDVVWWCPIVKPVMKESE